MHAEKKNMDVERIAEDQRGKATRSDSMLSCKSLEELLKGLEILYNPPMRPPVAISKALYSQTQVYNVSATEVNCCVWLELARA